MGGFNSGFQGIAKDTTAVRSRLSIRDWVNRDTGFEQSYRLRCKGWFALGDVHIRMGEGSLVLTFTPPNRDSWQQTILITRTVCTLGGSRPWFACPQCRRNCATLYAGLQGFNCRTCNQLNYPSTRETRDDQAATRRVDCIREQLGWLPGIAFGHGPKPKGMHYRTFQRLVAEHDRHVEAFTQATRKRLLKMSARLGWLEGQLG